MQRPGTEAIITQIKPSKPKQEIAKITNSQNTKRTYGQPSEKLFPKRWPLSNPNVPKMTRYTFRKRKEAKWKRIRVGEKFGRAAHCIFFSFGYKNCRVKDLS